jgi:hypothetical protein
LARRSLVQRRLISDLWRLSRARESRHRDFHYDTLSVHPDCQFSILTKPCTMTDEQRRKLRRVAQKIIALSRGSATPEKAGKFFRSYVRLNRYMNRQRIFQLR